MKKPNLLNNYKVTYFWTIWALGFYGIRDYNSKLFELKIFIGPIVFTFWR